MIWFLTPLPTGRTHAQCRLCGDEGTHMNDRAAELWARYHDPVQCGRRARVQKAALTPVAGEVRNDLSDTAARGATRHVFVGE